MNVSRVLQYKTPPTTTIITLIVHYAVAGLKTYSCSTTDSLLYTVLTISLRHCTYILNIIYNGEKTMELRTVVSSKSTKINNFDLIFKKDTGLLVTYLHL